MYTVTYGVSSDDCNSISACAYCTTCLAYSTSKRERSQFIYVCVLSLPLFFFFFTAMRYRVQDDTTAPFTVCRERTSLSKCHFSFFFFSFQTRQARERCNFSDTSRGSYIYIYICTYQRTVVRYLQNNIKVVR